MTATLLTGPIWLAEMFDGSVNSSNTAKIEVRWIEGLPYIAPEVLTDPTYTDALETEVQGKTVAEWLELVVVELPDNIEE